MALVLEPLREKQPGKTWAESIANVLLFARHEWCRE
jgi:hypothetical protein